MLLEDKTILKSIKKSVKESFVASILLFIFALVLFKNPENFLSVAINVFGYIAIFIGAIEFVCYFYLPKNERILSNRFLTGLLLVSFGIVAFFENDLLKSVTTFLLGGYCLFQNASRTNLAINLQIYKTNLWIYVLVISIINLLGSLLIMINPFETVFQVNTYVSIMMMVIEILFMIQNVIILFGLKGNQPKKENKIVKKEKE